MNKKHKYGALFAGALILTGTVFTICGLLTGGTINFQYSFGKTVHTKSSKKEKENLTVTKNLKMCDNLLIDCDDPDIQIISGNKFTITYPSKENLQIKYDDNNEKVTISEKSKSVFCSFSIDFTDFNLNEEKSDNIIITVPKETKFEHINIKSSDGDCCIRQQYAKNLDIQLNYGDLTMKDCSATSASLTASDGNINISKSNIKKVEGSFDYGSCTIKDSEIATSNIRLSDGDFSAKDSIFSNMDASLNYGDFNGENITIDKIHAKLDDGDFRAIINGKKEEYSASLSSDDGNIQVDKKNIGNGTYSNTSTGTKSIDINNSFGDIKLKFKPLNE